MRIQPLLKFTATPLTLFWLVFFCGFQVIANDYVTCVDNNGDGQGHLPNSVRFCQIPPRFDVANILNMRDEANSFTDLTYNIEQEQCSSNQVSTALKGCFHSIQSQDPSFLEFAATNNISRYGVSSKFFPAGNNNNVYDKVVVIVGPHSSIGFRTIDQEISWVLKESQGSHFVNLLQYFHNEGFSILYVSFTHPSSNMLPVEDKSEALIKLLYDFRTLRQRNSTPTQEPLNLVGLSLGGVISKFSLVKMEQRHYAHDVGVYMSVDGPHQGAHVPVSIQQVALFLRDAFRYAARKTSVSGLFHFLVPFSEQIHAMFNAPIRSGSSQFQSASNSAQEAYQARIGNISNSELIAYNIQYPQNEFRSPQYEKFLRRSAELKMPTKTKVNIAVTNASLTGRGLTLPKDYVSLQTAKKSGTRLSFRAGTDTSGTVIFDGQLDFPNRNALYLDDRTFYQKMPIADSGSYKSRDLLPCSTSEEVVGALVSSIDTATEGVWSEKSKVYNSSTCFVPVGSSLNTSLPRPFIHWNSHSVAESQFDEVIGTSQNSGHLSFGKEITDKIIAHLSKHRPVLLPLTENTVYYLHGRNLLYQKNNSCIHADNNHVVAPSNRINSDDARYSVLRSELINSYSANRIGNCYRYAQPQIGVTYYIRGRSLRYFPSKSCLHDTNDVEVSSENNMDQQGAQDPRYATLITELNGAYRNTRSCTSSFVP